VTEAIKDHPSAAGVRRALDRNGLHVSEQADRNLIVFVARNGDGEEAVTVRLSRDDGGIRSHITDHRPGNRRGAREHHFRYRDRQAGGIEKSDRQAIDASRTCLAECVARYALPDAPPEPDADTLADRIRETIEADPDGAAEALARAVAEATDAETTDRIAEALGAALAYRG
jgi:hypothetical protein